MMKKIIANKRKFICEELEPRILLSAGIEGLVYDSGWEPDTTLEADTDAAQIVALFNSQPDSSEPTLEIVFIDSSLPDYQSLIADLENNDDASRQFEIILLNEQDGIAQITAYLESQDNIDAIHFITHGEDGVIQLGNDQLELGNIDTYSSDFLLWQNALDEDADILFYGCDVASSSDGLSLIQEISALTDADVSASDDITGSAELGGDWILEKNIGSIETSIAFSTALQNTWTGILPTTSFQEGVSGYSSTMDTSIDSSSPADNNGTEESVDVYTAMGSSGQGLILFDDIFGTGPGQIPPGATITSATLTITVVDISAGGATTIDLHAMLTSWNDSSTWNSLGNGVQLNDTEASSLVDSSIAANASGTQTFSGLESTLQSWSDDPASNYGWVIINNSSSNTWGFDQSDYAAGTAPILTITYTTNIDPVITSSSTASVIENTSAATPVMTVTATDADGDTLTFSITGGTADDLLFSIDTNTGVLTFNAAPNFDTPGDIGTNNVYNIVVTADDGNGGLTTQNIAVTVTNVNEAPVIDSVTGTFTAAENTTSVVATAAASDVDAGDTLTYSLAAGTDAAFFSIDAAGAITFTAPDFDTPVDANGDNTFDIQVIVTDALGLQSTQNISVSLTNANEAPVIDSVTGTFTAAENTTSVVATAAASDADAGDTLTYSLAAGTDAAFFSIDAAGAITFTAPDFDTPVDANGDNTFDIQVIVTDALGLQSTQNISVSLTNANEAPVIDSLTGTFTAAENTTSVVATAAASDADAGDTLTYSLGGVDAGFFAIDAAGAITFTAPDFDTPVDTNGDNTFDIQVIVTDALGLQSTQNISVSLTNANEAPVIDSVTGTFTAAENTTTVVATAAASDVDAGDTLTYSLGGVDAGFFAIDAAGAITFTAPDFDTPVDANGDNTFDIQVIVTDALGLQSTQNISVSLTNANEAPVIDSLTGTFTAAENTTSVVATAAASDVDAGDTLTYSLGGVDAGFFLIDAAGAITFNAPDFDIAQDNNGDNTYEIQVIATDALGDQDTQNISVSLTNTNEAPVIDSVTGTFTAAENTTSVVATAAASDVDAGDTLTYSLGGVDAGFFAIDAAGAITFTAPDFDTPVDANGDNTFDIQVIVTDALGLQSTQNISVSLTNANEAPVIDSVTGTFTAAENTTSVVATAAASDVDAGDTLTFSLAGTPDAAFFSIDAAGAITFTAPDFDIPQDANGDNTFDIQVIVTDALGLQSTQNISVSLTNTNEAPVIDSVTGTFTAAENTTSVVATAAASDVDAGDTLTFSLAGTPDAAFFSIDAAGAITFTAPDFDIPQDANGDNTFDIQVIVTDALGLQSTQNISVTLTNVNEVPVITSGAAPSIAENTTAVTTVTATDVDGDIPTFSITGGADSTLFSITAGGVLTFNAAPDFETPLDGGGNNVYDIQVTANDGNGGTTIQSISITVTDVNEVPSFNDQQFFISGDSVNGSIAGTVIASDLDAGDTLSYSITEGTGLGYFSIDSSTGKIIVTNSDALESNVAQIYTLTVLVTDSFGNISSSTISISVSASTISTPIDVSPPPGVINTSPERVDFISKPTSESGGYIFHSRLIQTHTDPVINDNDPENNTIKSTESRDIKVDWLSSSRNVFSSEYLSYRSGGAFNDALDSMIKDIDESDESRANSILSAGIRGSGIALTVGFASWVLRGSSILASFLSTIPVWRGLDPLPILAAARKKQKKDVNISKNKKNTTEPDDVDEIFDEPNNNSTDNSTNVNKQGKLGD